MLGYALPGHESVNEHLARREPVSAMDHMSFQMPSMGRPALLNPPPQIFGGYSQEGMPVSQIPPELAAQMFPDHATLLDDANEAKRRRIARVLYRSCFRKSWTLGGSLVAYPGC